MHTNDEAQMLGKPLSHIGLTCHLYVTCKINSEENTVLSKYQLYNFELFLEKFNGRI